MSALKHVFFLLDLPVPILLDNFVLFVSAGD